jgi:hypothetical protein
MTGRGVIALDIGDAPKRPLPQAEVRFVHGSLSPGDRMGARSLIQKNRPTMPGDLNESSRSSGVARHTHRSQALPGSAWEPTASEAPPREAEPRGQRVPSQSLGTR